jgi:glycosyltransferase involved in cell wall biosynthesis
MPRIPVAVFLHAFHPGGTERQTIELIRRLNRDRFEVHVACFHREGAWLPRAEEFAASVTAFPITGFRRAATLSQAHAFSRWCRRSELKIVYTADHYANIFAMPAAAMAGVPVRIAARREINAGKSAAQIALQRAAYACAHRIVANCAAAAERLVKECVPRWRIDIIHNGLDVDRYSPRDTPRPIRRIVTVANLRIEKGHDVLLEAAQLVLRRYPDTEFVLAGDGPRRTHLEALARRLEIASRIRFLGHCDNVPALLADCDAFVLSSHSEAFPNGILEAMAAGLPVVASRVGGILELIEHQRTGVLVTPGDARALGFALLDLMGWEDHAAALGRAARRAVETRYSFDRMVGGYERLYASELAKHAVVAPSPTEVVAS